MDQPAKRTTCRIVICDDNIDAANSYALFFRLGGHIVWTANDGIAAMKLVEEHQPDAVLLDLGMPRISGFMVAKQIRETQGLKQPRIITISGYPVSADLEKRNDLKIHRHFIKPADLEELLRCILHNESCD